MILMLLKSRLFYSCLRFRVWVLLSRGYRRFGFFVEPVRISDISLRCVSPWVWTSLAIRNKWVSLVCPIRMRLSIDCSFFFREQLVHRIVDVLTVFSLVFGWFHMLFVVPLKKKKKTLRIIIYSIQQIHGSKTK